MFETDDATLTIEDCKPHEFYEVQIESAEGSVRLQLHPIMGEGGGEGDDEEPADSKHPTFRIMISWVMKAGKLVRFAAKAVNTVEKIERIVHYFMQD